MHFQLWNQNEVSAFLRVYLNYKAEKSVLQKVGLEKFVTFAIRPKIKMSVDLLIYTNSINRQII